MLINHKNQLIPGHIERHDVHSKPLLAQVKMFVVVNIALLSARLRDTGRYGNS
jgi:hypothetical protein